MAERSCAFCEKVGTNFQRCGKCREVWYCNRDCQAKHWPKHKSECIPPEQKPKPVDEALGAEFVECEAFEDCRNFLIKHPEVITKDFADELYQKGWMALKTHPPAIGTRFIRNAQIIQYLLDLRKASGGQQDISLFFSRILDERNSEYRNSFVAEYTTFVKRVLQRIKEKEKEEQEKGKGKESSEQAPAQ